MSKTLSQIDFISNEQEFEDALILMQLEYSIINRNGKVFILNEKENDNGKNELVFTDIDSFKNYHLHLTLTLDIPNTTRKDVRNVASYFLKSYKTNRLDGIVFNPSKPSGVYQGKSGKFWNLWKGWKYKPVEGDVSKFLELVAINCNHDKETYEYHLDYHAQMIQDPMNLPRSSLVIKGPPGSGKGTYAIDTIAKLNDNSKVISNITMVTGDFNGHLADSFFVVLDEIMFNGQHKESNILKTFISENQRMINDKMKTAFYVDSYTRSIILSNNDLVVKIEDGDRRYVVSNCTDELKGNFKWFDDYQKWLKNGGYEAIMYYLMNRDISNYNTLEIPRSQEKIDLQLRGIDLHKRFLLEILNHDIEFFEGVVVSNKIYRQRLYEQYVDYVKRFAPGSYIQSINEFGKLVNKAFDYDKENPKWRTNWKDTSGRYFFQKYSEMEMQKRFAKNIMNCEPESIFFQHDDMASEEGSFIEDVFASNYK